MLTVNRQIHDILLILTYVLAKKAIRYMYPSTAVINLVSRRTNMTNMFYDFEKIRRFKR
jgi:hypothetical protein